MPPPPPLAPQWHAPPLPPPKFPPPTQNGILDHSAATIRGPFSTILRRGGGNLGGGQGWGRCEAIVNPDL
jgi:hypothetical protein